MNSDRIEDIPSYEELRKNISNTQTLYDALPWLNRILRLDGMTKSTLVDQKTKLELLAQEANTLITLPDRFNALFASRGWIMYEFMEVSTAQKAVVIAESGNVEEAEQVLVDFYDEEALRYRLIWMGNIRACQPRIPLLRLAKEDYLAGRYHACVPIILSQLDGLVSELSPSVNNHGKRGFFAAGSNLEAWDSISAHTTGLAQLARVLGADRHKTTTESISIPYRHGILHGIDLGYGNKMVAAKAWAALFSVRDWAIKVEQGGIIAPPPKAERSWIDIIRQIQDTNDSKARMEIWTARDVRLKRDFPETGEPDAYGEGSPERTLVEFLTAWRAGNYGRMTLYPPFSPHHPPHKNGKRAGQFREHYVSKPLHSFSLLEVRDSAPALTIITLKISTGDHAQPREEVIDFRLIYEDSSGHGVPRSKPEGSWRVLNYFV